MLLIVITAGQKAQGLSISGETREKFYRRNAQKIHVCGVALIKILGWHCAGTATICPAICYAAGFDKNTFIIRTLLESTCLTKMPT